MSIREVKAEKVKSICRSERFFLIFHVWTRLVVVVVSTNAERKHVEGAARALVQKQAQARTVRDTLIQTHTHTLGTHTYGTQTTANADTIHVDDVACIGFCLARPKPKTKHARTCSTSGCRCPASPPTTCLG